MLDADSITEQFIAVQLVVSVVGVISKSACDTTCPPTTQCTPNSVCHLPIAASGKHWPYITGRISVMVSVQSFGCLDSGRTQTSCACTTRGDGGQSVADGCGDQGIGCGFGGDSTGALTGCFELLSCSEIG